MESVCCVWVSAAVKKTVINAKLSQNCGDCSGI